MEDLTVTCPLVPNASRLISGFSSSPRDFALGFLCTPPRDDALALWLTFGSTYTWCRDFHPTGFVPCTAHIGIGRSLAAPPSHTTGHTGHVSGGSLKLRRSHTVLAPANSGSPI